MLYVVDAEVKRPPSLSFQVFLALYLFSIKTVFELQVGLCVEDSFPTPTGGFSLPDGTSLYGDVPPPDRVPIVD